MSDNHEWIKTKNLEPKEAKKCDYGFICWVDDEVELVGTNEGISWDEAKGFMPLYDLKLPLIPYL